MAKRKKKKVVKKKSRATVKTTNKENSTITFEIDKDLMVTIHSKINKNIVTSLIDKGYVKAVDAENEALIQVAFVLLANEISDQLLNDLTGLANETH